MDDAVLGRNSLCQAVEVPEVQQQVPTAQPEQAQAAVHLGSVRMTIHLSRVGHSCKQKQSAKTDAKSAVSSLHQGRLGIVEGRTRSSRR